MTGVVLEGRLEEKGVFLRDFFGILTASVPLEHLTSQKQLILTKMLIEIDSSASLYYNESI